MKEKGVEDNIVRDNVYGFSLVDFVIEEIFVNFFEVFCVLSYYEGCIVFYFKK